MEFEWHELKAASNEAKHGLTFDYASRVFLDPHLHEADASHIQDGEVRLKAVGMIDGRLFTVVYTRRNGLIRIISARRANVQEIRRYGDG